MRLFVSLLLVGCGSGTEVGNVCVAPVENGVTVASSPALECEGRTCLRVVGAEIPLCSADCTTDDDCDAFPETPCEGGFVCVAPFAVGDQACRKMCVCADDAANLTEAQCS